MKYGIRDSMLRLPFEQTFAEAKRIGFDGVEICIGGDYREHKLWSEAGITEIKKLSAEKQVSEMIQEISQNLASDMAYTPSTLSKFIGLCNYIKTSLLICDIHRDLESDIDEAICNECQTMLEKGPGSVY